MSEPFEFKQCVTLVKATGKKASGLRDLRELIAGASPASISHHTFEYFLKGHTLEYTNDFAHWAGQSLEENALAEQLSNIDPYACRDVEELRSELLDAIEAISIGCRSRGRRCRGTSSFSRRRSPSSFRRASGQGKSVLELWRRNAECGLCTALARSSRKRGHKRNAE